MTNYIHYIFVFATLIFISCAPIKYPHRSGLADLTENMSAINGNFKNFSIDTSSFFEGSFKHTSIDTFFFWSVLNSTPNKPKFKSLSLHPNSHVKLISQTKKRITAQLLIDSLVVDQMILRGKVKGSRFVLRRKVRYFGLPFLYLNHSDIKLQISIGNGQLYVDGTRGWAAMIFILSAGSIDELHFTFDSL